MKRDEPTSKFQSAANPNFLASQELLDSEIGLVGYTTDIVKKFAKKMKLQSRILNEGDKLLEFGAGTGFLAEIFKKEFGITPDCLEIDPKLVEVIRQKGFVCYEDMGELPGKYRAIYTSNVLEHIESDSLTLRALHDALLPGGVIGIFVPALPFLFSELDHSAGHVRRYTRRELKMKVRLAGFKNIGIHYVDFVGFFASLGVKTLGYKKRSNLGGVRSLLFYDKYLYPMSRRLDAMGFRHLIGKNLLLVAEGTSPLESND